MPFNIRSTLDAVANKLLTGAYFDTVLVGEPKSPPAGNGLTAAIFVSSMDVAELTLGTTIEIHAITVRVYRDMLAEPTEDIERSLALVTSDFMNDLCGEYDLGATIRNIDIGGQHGTSLGAQWGYAEISGKMYRVVDIAIPLIVDDSASLVA